jgi:DNA primase
MYTLLYTGNAHAIPLRGLVWWQQTSRLGIHIWFDSTRVAAHRPHESLPFDLDADSSPSPSISSLSLVVTYATASVVARASLTPDDTDNGYKV